MARKRTTRHVEEEIEEGLIEQHDQPDRSVDFPAVFAQYLAAHAEEGKTYNVVLFNHESTGYGTEPEVSYCGNFTNTVPTYDYIASTYGPGKYRLLLHYKKKQDGKPTSASVTMRISRAFRPLLDQPGERPQGPAVPALLQQSMIPQLTGPASENAMFGLVKHFMTIVEKIATAKTQPSNGGGDFVSVNKALGEMMIENAKTNMRLVNELVQNRAGLDEPEDDKPESIADWILFVWRNFGETILTGGKALQSMARQRVEADPRFDQLLHDPAVFNEAYQALVAEAGEEKVTKMLNILGVARPEVTPTGASEGGAPQTPEASGLRH